MKKYLFGQFRYERRFLCDIFIAEAGDLSFVCTLHITVFSKGVDEVERILENLTEKYGRVRVRPSRLDDIPNRFKKYFKSMDNDEYFGMFSSNPFYLEAENDENTEPDAFAKCCG